MTSQVDTNFSSYNPIGRRPLFNTSLVSPRQVVSWHVKNIIWRLQRHLFKTHLPPRPLGSRHPSRHLRAKYFPKTTSVKLQPEKRVRNISPSGNECEDEHRRLSDVRRWSDFLCGRLEPQLLPTSGREVSHQPSDDFTKMYSYVRSVWRRRKMYKCLKLYSYINTLWPNLRPPHCDPFTKLDLNCRDFYKTARFVCRTFASLQYK